MRNFKMTVEYDGTAYCGWQRQENGMINSTGAGRSNSSLLPGEKVAVIGSGRTDAGVHALNQVASFKMFHRDCRSTKYSGNEQRITAGYCGQRTGRSCG